MVYIVVSIGFLAMIFVIAFQLHRLETKLDRTISIVTSLYWKKRNKIIEGELQDMSKAARQVAESLVKKENSDKTVHVSGGVQEEIDRYESVKNLKEVPPDDDELFERAKEDK